MDSIDATQALVEAGESLSFQALRLATVVRKFTTLLQDSRSLETKGLAKIMANCEKILLHEIDELDKNLLSLYHDKYPGMKYPEKR